MVNILLMEMALVCLHNIHEDSLQADIIFHRCLKKYPIYKRLAYLRGELDKL